MSKGPLTGIRVLDLSHAMSGPFATQKLADMGADVIKIESPKGDFSRWQSIANAFVGEFTTGFLSLNRNKKSIVIDLKSDEGRNLFYQMVAGADVVLQNFRPGAAERLSIHYEAVKQVNPGIVYCSISGYGEEGPYKHRPGQDLVIQGYSGSLYNIGNKNDVPMANGLIVCDPTASHLAVTGILAAYIHKLKTGEGQKVEVDMLSGILDLQVQEVTTYLNTGLVPERTEEPLAHPFINAPYGVYRTRDGYLTIAMCPIHVLGEALEHEELKQMTSWQDGMTHRDRIFRIVREALPSKTTEEWLERFDALNIWCGPVKRLDEICQDEQVRINGMIQTYQDEELGELSFLGNPVRFSKTPTAIYSKPPRLGEHTGAILKELGLDDIKINKLADKGVVGGVNMKVEGETQ